MLLPGGHQEPRGAARRRGEEEEEEEAADTRGGRSPAAADGGDAGNGGDQPRESVLGAERGDGTALRGRDPQPATGARRFGVKRAPV